MTVIAPTFDDSVRDLHGHPAITVMAAELLAAHPDVRAQLITRGGTPTSRLMDLANDRFAVLTRGEHGRYVGSVATAVTARLTELLRQALRELNAALPDAVTEARAAELEARQAIRDMWRHGSPRCPLTHYATIAGNLADRAAAERTN